MLLPVAALTASTSASAYRVPASNLLKKPPQGGFFVSVLQRIAVQIQTGFILFYRLHHASLLQEIYPCHNASFPDSSPGE
jgi:hypothetical protein